MELKPIPEVEKLLPAPGEQSDEILEQMILETRCVSPILVWKGTDQIISGSRRKKICEKHNIPYEIQEIECESREQAIEYAIKEQISRRNMSARQIAILYSDTSIADKVEQMHYEAGATPSAVNYAKKIGEQLARIKELAPDFDESQTLSNRFLMALSGLSDREFKVVLSATGDAKERLISMVVGEMRKVCRKVAAGIDVNDAIREVSRVYMAKSGGEGEFFLPILKHTANAIKCLQRAADILERGKGAKGGEVIRSNMRIISSFISDAIKIIMDMTPSGQCDSCGGAGCHDCGGRGWVCGEDFS